MADEQSPPKKQENQPMPAAPTSEAKSAGSTPAPPNRGPAGVVGVDSPYDEAVAGYRDRIPEAVERLGREEFQLPFRGPYAAWQAPKHRNRSGGGHAAHRILGSSDQEAVAI